MGGFLGERDKPITKVRRRLEARFTILVGKLEFVACLFINNQVIGGARWPCRSAECECDLWRTRLWRSNLFPLWANCVDKLPVLEQRLSGRGWSRLPRRRPGWRHSG